MVMEMVVVVEVEMVVMVVMAAVEMRQRTPRFSHMMVQWFETGEFENYRLGGSNHHSPFPPDGITTFIF